MFNGGTRAYYGRQTGIDAAGTEYPFVANLDETATTASSLFGSHHQGMVQFALCDGSVRSIQNSTPVAILSLLAKREDGQVIPGDY